MKPLWDARGLSSSLDLSHWSDRELLRILRAEIASLLEQASALRAVHSPYGAFLEDPPISAGGPSEWRGRALAALERIAEPAQSRGALARADDHAAAALLGELAASPATGWPSASLLARAALCVEGSTRHKLALAHALLAEGSVREARAELAALLATDPAPDALWRAYAGLALAHESAGNDVLALGAAERAAELAGCGAGPLVDSLFLALTLGDLARAVKAGARLDRLLAGDAPELAQAIGRLRLRIELLRGGFPWLAPRSTRAFARELSRGGLSAAGRVVLALLESAE